MVSVGCGGGGDGSNGGNQGGGTVDTTPPVVLSTNPSNQATLTASFSEITPVQIPKANHMPGSPEPTLAATANNYGTKLQLETTKPVTFCVGWWTKPSLNKM